jgi:hypothetical protein
LINKDDLASIKDSGVFNLIRLAINKELYISSQDKTIPFKDYETGKLQFGVGNPENADYDSLSDCYYDEDNNIIEMRIPWALLNFKDPSTKEIMGDIWQSGIEGSEIIDGFNVSVVTYKPDENGNATASGKEVNIADSLPKPENGILKSEKTYFYTWENWELPLTHERLKQSYYILKEVYGLYN